MTPRQQLVALARKQAAEMAALGCPALHIAAALRQVLYARGMNAMTASSVAAKLAKETKNSSPV